MPQEGEEKLYHKNCKNTPETSDNIRWYISCYIELRHNILYSHNEVNSKEKVREKYRIYETKTPYQRVTEEPLFKGTP